LGGLWSVNSAIAALLTFVEPNKICGIDTVLTSPRLLNLPLLLLANKQDALHSLSPAEIRESFDAWHRAKSEQGVIDLGDPDEELSKRKSVISDFDGAQAERMASLDVLGVSGLTG
jgi:ADP-ribosylation factor related protein 1